MYKYTHSPPDLSHCTLVRCQQPDLRSVGHAETYAANLYPHAPFLQYHVHEVYKNLIEKVDESFMGFDTRFVWFLLCCVHSDLRTNNLVGPHSSNILNHSFVHLFACFSV